MLLCPGFLWGKGQHCGQTITSLVKKTSLAPLSAFFLYLISSRKHFNHRNFSIYVKNPVCRLSKWGKSCWTKYLCQWNSIVLRAFCGKPNTAKKRTLVCAFFRCKRTLAFIYHTVQMTTVSNHLIAGLSHDLLRETQTVTVPIWQLPEHVHQLKPTAK